MSTISPDAIKALQVKIDDVRIFRNKQAIYYDEIKLIISKNQDLKPKALAEKILSIAGLTTTCVTFKDNITKLRESVLKELKKKPADSVTEESLKKPLEPEVTPVLEENKEEKPPKYEQVWVCSDCGNHSNHFKCAEAAKIAEIIQNLKCFKLGKYLLGTSDKLPEFWAEVEVIRLNAINTSLKDLVDPPKNEKGQQNAYKLYMTWTLLKTGTLTLTPEVLKDLTLMIYVGEESGLNEDMYRIEEHIKDMLDSINGETIACKGKVRHAQLIKGMLPEINKKELEKHLFRGLVFDKGTIEYWLKHTKSLFYLENDRNTFLAAEKSKRLLYLESMLIMLFCPDDKNSQGFTFTANIHKVDITSHSDYQLDIVIGLVKKVRGMRKVVKYEDYEIEFFKAIFEILRDSIDHLSRKAHNKDIYSLDELKLAYKFLARKICAKFRFENLISQPEDLKYFIDQC